MKAVQLFDVEDYTPFNFNESLKKIYQKSISEHQIAHNHNGYFAVPGNFRQKQIDNQDIRFFEQEFLSRQNIYIGKFISPKKYSPDITIFLVIELIKEECLWVIYFLDLLIKHLNQREAEGIKLLNHNNLRMRIAKIVQTIEEINSIIILPHLNQTPYFEHIKNIINQACNDLAKLAGGRAFLSKSILEMLFTFEAINHIYLN